jgi:hypothetical protein
MRVSGKERMEDKGSWRTGEGEDSVRRNKKEKTEHMWSVRLDRELQTKRMLNIWRTEKERMIYIWRNGAVDHRGELEDWRRRGTVELEKERTEVAFWRGEDGG